MYKDDINSDMPNHFEINLYFDIYINIGIFKFLYYFLGERLRSRHILTAGSFIIF
jgi:hypothetical protein